MGAAYIGESFYVVFNYRVFLVFARGRSEDYRIVDRSGVSVNASSVKVEGISCIDIVARAEYLVVSALTNVGVFLTVDDGRLLT